MHLHQPSQISFCLWVFSPFQFIYLLETAWIYIASPKQYSAEKSWFKYFKQREVKSVLQKQVGTARAIEQNPSMEMLCSPLCYLNYREGLEFHWRLQAAMGSHDVASILLSFSWLWFWSLILEGKCCFCFSWSETFWTLYSYYFLL